MGKSLVLLLECVVAGATRTAESRFLGVLGVLSTSTDDALLLLPSDSSVTGVINLRSDVPDLPVVIESNEPSEVDLSVETLRREAGVDSIKPSVMNLVRS